MVQPDLSVEWFVRSQLINQSERERERERERQ